MPKQATRFLPLALCLAVPIIPAQTDAAQQLRTDVVRGYAHGCHALYSRCLQEAKLLQSAVAALLAKPDATTLTAARTAWATARRVYGETEALRYYDGPIEPLEPLLNAWPIDEAFLDYVEGQPNAGIVNDPQHFPQLGATALVLANERGGEANVSVGWHAIEFLLWGQDLSTTGPGNRPASDYQPGVGPNAVRRREYLTVVTDLLVRQLGELQAAWAPNTANYRRAFEADPATAIRRMLTGTIVLTAFELTGERLAVAYETQDQEQEHSCFSDTTGADLEANQRGIEAICTGGPDAAFGPGLLALLQPTQPAAAADLRTKLATATARLRAIPQPFDQAIRGDDTAPGRLAIKAALQALEDQAESIAIAGRLLGHELPLHPGR